MRALPKRVSSWARERLVESVEIVSKFLRKLSEKVAALSKPSR